MQFTLSNSPTEQDFYHILVDYIYGWEDWLGPNRGYIYVSPSCERTTGYRAEEFHSDPLLLQHIAHPDDLDLLKQRLSEVSGGKASACEMEFRIFHRNGEIRWISHFCQPIYQADGKWMGLRCSNRDITKQKMVEESLRESMETIKVLINLPTDLSFMLDTEGKILVVSDTLAKLFGKEPDELVGMCIWDLFKPDVTQRLKGVIEQALKTGKPIRYEDPSTLESNPSVLYDSVIYPVKDNHGEITRIAVLARDISERKRAEKELHESMKTIQMLVDIPPDISMLIDPQGILIAVGNTLTRKLGQTSQKLIGKCIWDLLPFEASRRRKEVVERVLQTGESIRFEDQNALGPDPDQVYDTLVHPLRDGNGQITRISILAHDVTERKRTEKALQESMETVKTLLNLPTEISLLLDPEGKILMVNEVFARTTNLPAEKLVGLSVWDFFPPLVTDFRKSVFENAIRSGKPIRFEDRGSRWPPANQSFDAIVYPICDVHGKVIQVAILAHDVTDRKNIEQALKQRDAVIRAVIQNAPISIWAVDLKGTITLAEGGEQVQPGLQPGMEVGQNASNFFSNRPEVIKNLKLALEGEEAAELVKVDNSSIYDTRYAPILDTQGNILGATCIGIDVTEHIRAREEIRQSWYQLQVILDGVADNIIALDPTGKIIYANQMPIPVPGHPSLTKLLTEPSPEHLTILDVDGLPLTFDKLPPMQAVRGTRTEPTVLHMHSSNGNGEMWASVKATPIFDGDDKLQMAVAITHDITELKRAELELQRAQKWLELRIAERTQELAEMNQKLRKEITERIYAEERMRRKASQAEALARVASRLNAHLDLATVLNTICEEAIRVIPSMSAANVMLCDEQKDILYIAASFGHEPGFASAFKPLPRATYEGRVEKFGPVMIIPEITTLPDLINFEAVAKSRTRTLVSICMMQGDELIGSLDVTSHGEVYIPSQDELALVQALANQASTAIANARLFERVFEGQKRLHALSQKLVEIQESEHRNLARELHDEIGQKLTSLHLTLNMMSRTAEQHNVPSPSLTTNLAHAQDLVGQLLRQIRDLSLDLRPALLDDLGLLPALLSHLDRYTALTGIEVNFKHNGVEGRFSPEIETAAFRIIQEALTNVARHASVKEVDVRLWANEQMLGLQVEDRGKGFDPEAIQTSRPTSGLSGMYERATMCDGLMDIETGSGTGTRLTAEFPLDGIFAEEST